MKKYIFGNTECINRTINNFIDITAGFSIDVRMDDECLTITIGNADGTLKVSDWIDCSAVLNHFSASDIESDMLITVGKTLMDMITDTETPTFTDYYELIEEWEEKMQDRFLKNRTDDTEETEDENETE